MNNTNLAETARERAAEQDTNFYNLGSFHGSLGISPLHVDKEEYWQGYQEQRRNFWLEEQSRSQAENFETKEKLGFLYATCEEIEAVYGALSPIGEEQDYQGWEIEINGLAIELATLDWENARGDRFWNIYSSHPDALKFLGEVFGSWNVTSLVTDYSSRTSK